MAQVLFEGDFIGRCVKPELGKKGGTPIVRIEMEVGGDGEHKGRRVTYEGKLDDSNIKYTKRAMLAIGWKGVKSATFVDDVKAANLVVPFKVEIARWESPDGLREWSSVKYIGSGAKPLEALDADKLKDVDRWFHEAGDVGTPAGGEDDNRIPF